MVYCVECDNYTKDFIFVARTVLRFGFLCFSQPKDRYISTVHLNWYLRFDSYVLSYKMIIYHQSRSIQSFFRALHLNI